MKAVTTGDIMYFHEMNVSAWLTTLKSALKKSKEVQLTEYVLIGTLLNFGATIDISLVYKYLVTIV